MIDDLLSRLKGDKPPGTTTGPLTRVHHGGNLDAARMQYGTPDDGWLDLSTGINPVAYPVPKIAHESWTRLPGSDAMRALQSAALKAYGAQPSTPIVAAPGAQALIQLMPRLHQNARVAIAGPTYAEHAAVWAASGATVVEVAELDLHAAEQFDVVVCVNPNNPTGRAWPAAPLMMLARVLSERGGLLIVDESFADAAPQWQLAGKCGSPGLLVIRSFGKLYGLAGLRLGFALGCRETVDQLRDWLGPWAVSGPAIDIATAALHDEAWRETTRERLQADSDKLAARLTRHDFEIVGRTPYFVTVSRTDGHALHRRLAQRGIWTRAFDYAPTWLRFGVTSSDADLDRLDAALSVDTSEPSASA